MGHFILPWRHIRWFSTCWLLLVAAGCLLPSALLHDQSQSSPPIRYRLLTRRDFQADRAPAQLRPHATRLGAALCGQIRLDPESGFQARRIRHEDGGQSYSVRIQRLEFHAEMLPHCSWWNPQIRTRDANHVLQHEQVHFALIELAARQLNLQAQDLVRDFEVSGTTRHEVESSAQQHIEALAETALVRLQERHNRFDDQSRNQPLPEHRQWVWWNQVQTELSETAGAHPPPER